MSSNLIGKSFSGYKIMELIGRGGMGLVFRAHDVGLDRDVALKMMDPMLSRDETFMRRFRVEAQALARLRNDNVVTIYQLCETESDLGVFIVMEYVEGLTLGQIVKERGRLDEEYVVDLFTLILDGLEHAHKVGVIHRDIKPSNIIVTKNNTVKITDFGLAKIQRTSGETVTQFGGGTIYYSSPEQLDGQKKIDHRADIYSVGMTLYECLTGAVPFQPTDSTFRILKIVSEGTIPPPRKVRPDMSRALNDIVVRAISVDPAKRYQSAQEMKAALRAISMRKEEPGKVEKKKEKGKVENTQPAEKKNTLLIVSLALGILVLLVTVVLWFRTPPSASLSVTAPSIGTTWITGSKQSVTWNSQNVVGTVNLAYSTNGGSTFVEWLGQSLDNTGVAFVLVPKHSTDSAVVKVVSTSDTTIVATSEMFSIEGTTLSVRSPLAGEKWASGGRYAVAWTSKNITGNLTIRYSADNGAPFSTLASDVANTGTTEIVAPMGSTENGRIKIESASDPHVFGISDPFVIVRPDEVSAKLIVACTPANASVKVNGKTFQGPQPFLVKPGVWTVLVSSGSHVWRKELRLSADRLTRVEIDFTKLVTLTVRAFEPDGTTAIEDAEIIVDDIVQEATTPGNVKVGVGEHRVTEKHPLYDSAVPKLNLFEADSKLTFVLRKKD